MKAEKNYKYKVRLNNPKSIVRCLSRVINDLRSDSIEESKARALGYLCNVMLKAFEVTDLVERIEKLEERL